MKDGDRPRREDVDDPRTGASPADEKQVGAEEPIADGDADGSAPAFDLDEDGDAPVFDLDEDDDTSVEALLAATDAVVGGAVEPGPSIKDDSGTVSDRSERDRLLAAALADVQVRDANYRQPLSGTASDPPWRGPLGVLLLAAAIWVWFSPPGWAVPEGPDPLDPAEVERGLRAAVQVVAHEIEVYRLLNGTLPSSLDDVGVEADGIRYVRSNNRVYQLVTYRPDGRVLLYDSARPAAGFARSVEPWVGMGQP